MCTRDWISRSPRYRRWAGRLSRSSGRCWRNWMREEAEFVDVREESDVSPDPNDNAFCSCAEQGRAAFIVTLNRKDFPQERRVAKVIAPGDPLPTTRRRRS